MVNFKLINEIWKVNWSTCHKRGTKKKIGVPDRNQIHDLPKMWQTLFSGSWVWFLLGTQIFCLSYACVMLINSPFTFHYWVKIHHLYSLINIKYTLICKIGAFQIPDNCFHLYHLIPAQGHTASVKEESLLVQLSWPWLFHCHERVFWELLHNKHQGAN